MRKALIVNADDFGLTEGVSRGIVEAHQNGILTSASLLANGEAFGSAVAAAGRLATLGIGVHLNLTDGAPVCEPSHVASLLAPGGVFPGSPGAVAERILTGKAKLEEVEREWRCQIGKILAADIAITHLDSHKHIHLLPPVFDVMIKLAREFRIPGVRHARESLTAALGALRIRGGQVLAVTKQFMVARGLSSLAAWQEKKMRAAGIRSPQRLYGLTQTGFLEAQSLNELLHALPEGIGELMCHPGYLDPGLVRTRTRLRSQREKELAALTQPGLKDRMAGWGIDLISYRDLAGNRPENTPSSTGQMASPVPRKA